MGLITLPQETFENILAYLDAVSLVKCSRTCKRFFGTVGNSDLLQYIVELGVAGYIDNPTHPARPKEKLQLLSKQVSYWKEMNLNEVVYEQVGYGSEPAWTASKESLSGFVFGGDASEPALEALEIRPWPPREKPRRRRVTYLIDPASKVLRIDPAQNLLVILIKEIVQTEDEQEQELIRIRLLDLTIGLPHSEAKLMELPLSPNCSPQDTSIMGSLITISSPLGWSGAFEIMIYNWRTGTLIQRVESSDKLGRSFQLISETHYIILVARESTEEEQALARRKKLEEDWWSERTSDSGSGSERGHSVGISSDGKPNSSRAPAGEKLGPKRGVEAQYAIQVCRLKDNLVINTYHLPFFPEDWSRPFIRCPTDEVTTPGDDTFLPSEAPFRGPPEPKLYLVSFDFQIGSEWGSGTSFIFVTLISSLISESAVGSGSVFPWSEWGHENVCYFARPGTGRYAHESISGYRVLTPYSLLQFNPLDVHRDRCRGQRGHGPIQYDCGELDQCEMVDYLTMHGNLAFREVRHSIPTEDMQTLINEHSITGFGVRNSHFFL